MRPAALLWGLLSSCAHLAQPAQTRKIGTHVLASLNDGSRLSGELVAADAEVIVIGDAASTTHFTCLSRGSLSSLATTEGQTVLFPFLGLGVTSPTAMTPVVSPGQGTPIAEDLEALRARARSGAEIPAQIMASCARR